MISFSGVTKIFSGREVLSDLSFQVNPGEFVCLTGPSGAGKSTIVHLLIRAELPTKGVIDVDGADLATLPPTILQLFRQRTGVVFQDYKLLPDRTVEENVSFALEVCGIAEDDVAERTADVLTRFELTDRADAFPHELSGGEKTRTALARALVHNPTILIADEPTGNIDPDQAQRILRHLKLINSEGTTVILATHDKTVVDVLGVRVLRLENGKLVRDSIGGYTEENTVVKKEELISIGETVAVEDTSGGHKTHAPRRHTSHSAHHGHHKKKETDEESTSIKPTAIQ